MRAPHTGRSGAGRRAVRGFTLIEVMMAMGIMSFGMFAVVALQVMAMRGNAYARERTEAKDLLDSVVDDVRTRSMQWVHLQQGTAPSDFPTAYGGVLVLSPAPDPGDTVPADELRSLPFLLGVSIASGPAFNGAYFLDVHGQPGRDGANAVLDASIQRAIYRVHYYAFQVTHPRDQTVLMPLVRLTVFVSWDNKTHGEQTHGFDDVDPDEFFDRHVVSASFYVSLDRLW